MVRVSGEKQINENEWGRFCKEIAMPTDSDTSGISDKFEAGMLYVRLPKMMDNNNINSKKLQSPNFNAPTPTPTKPATTTVPKQEAPNPHDLLRLFETVHVDNYKCLKGAKFNTNINKRKVQSCPTNTAPTPKVPPTKPPQPQPKLEVPKPHEQPQPAEPPQKVKKGKAMVSQQSQEYMNAVSGLVEGDKQQKKLVKVLLLTLLVFLFGVFVKNAIKAILLR